MNVILQAIKSLFRKMTLFVESRERVIRKDIAKDITKVKAYVNTVHNKAESAVEIANELSTSKLDKENPVCTGAFALNPKEGAKLRKGSMVIGQECSADGYGTPFAGGVRSTASGDYSFAFGIEATASGRCAVSIGEKTMASGDSSFACGCGYNNSGANGTYSFAGGYASTASGSRSMAMGYSNIASGDSAVAMGRYTTAEGDFSHTVGSSNRASGLCSFAEGFATVAASENQHTQGKYNVKDADGKYAHIVGNGEEVRSNAYTLDWNGVGWFAGGLQVGGNAQDDGAQTVMLNGDKEIILASSTEGSTRKLKITVDDSGTLAATEVT